MANASTRATMRNVQPMSNLTDMDQRRVSTTAHRRGDLGHRRDPVRSIQET
jgi:hypothetical protein